MRVVVMGYKWVMERVIGVEFWCWGIDVSHYLSTLKRKHFKVVKYGVPYINVVLDNLTTFISSIFFARYLLPCQKNHIFKNDFLLYSKLYHVVFIIAWRSIKYYILRKFEHTIKTTQPNKTKHKTTHFSTKTTQNHTEQKINIKQQ